MKILPSLILLILLLSNAVSAQVFDTAQGYFEDASRLHAASEDESAVIQLRNGLQLYADHVPSLVLLGKIQLELRNTGEAMQMLEEALLLGADPSIVVELLAETFIQRGEYSRLLLELPLDDIPESNLPALIAAHAQANIALGRLPEAQTLIERGTTLSPGSLEVRLAKFLLLLRQGRFDESEELAEQLLKEYPEDTRSWNAWASLRQLRGDISNAVKGYRKAIALESYNAGARVALISLLFDSGDLEAAGELTAWMRANIPQDPRGAYFTALIAASTGDRTTEQAELAKAAEIFDAVSGERFAADPQMQMIGALTYYSQGANEKARTLAAQYVSEHEQDNGAARLFASILISMDEADEAVQLLRPRHRRNPDDEPTAIALASALNASNRPLEAARLLERLNSSRKESSGTGRKLALTLLDAGNTRAGTALLEKVLAKEELSDHDSMTLILAYLRDGAWPQARDRLDDLKATNSDNPLIDNLRAISLTGEGRQEQAIEVLKSLTQEHPDFYPAWTNLARLLRTEGNLTEARAALETARRLARDDPRLDYEMALQFLLEGDLAEALRYAERAAGGDPLTVSFAALEVEIQFALGNSDAALDVALRVSSVDKAPAAMRRLLASTQARAGDRQQAVLTLKRAARAADFNAAELNAIAEQQIALGDYMGAGSALTASLQGDPGNTFARRARVQVAIGLQESEEAVSLAAELVKQRPANPVDRLLFAEANMAAKTFAVALRAFQRAEDLGSGDMAVIGQLDALQAMSRNDEAKARMAEYLNAGGRNAEIRGRYADQLIQSESWSEALAVLEDMAGEFPKVATVLNNLAVTQHQLGQAQALETARRALALDSDNPFFNDTVGWILLTTGSAEESLSFLREATTRAARNPELRYHLGAALGVLGRQSEARRELEQALAEGKDFRGRQDAEMLLQDLTE